jgi:hypothetical protein
MQTGGQVECNFALGRNGRSEGEERLISGEDIKDIAAPVK